MTAALIARLRTADPDRLAMALLAPRAARDRLLTLYALNDELARTALAAREPMVAQIRVRWWADRLADMAGGAPQPHELLTPLWQAWGTGAAALAPLAEARIHDATREPLADADAVDRYAQATGGALMGYAAAAVGLKMGETARAQGRGAALVAWLRARAALEPLGLAVARPSAEVLPDLAARARAAFAEATAGRRAIPRPAAPVLFPGAGMAAALAAAERGQDPAPASDFARRAGLARLALTGRWWL